MFFMERLNVSEDVREIARANADVAFDQRFARHYASSEACLKAHLRNVLDTLAERSVTGDADTNGAIALYLARLAEHYAAAASNGGRA